MDEPSTPAPAGSPTPFPCPNCGGPVTPGDRACARCGLGLLGPDAVELGEVDAELDRLLRRRHELLVALGAGRAVGRTGVAGPAVAAGSPDAGSPDAGSRDAGPRRSGPAPTGFGMPPRPMVGGGQQLLLALGVLLVLTAGIVFLAVNWDVLGAAGQLGVALASAAGAGLLSAWARRRGLRSSGEAFAALTAALLGATALGARLLDVFPAVDGVRFAAVAAAVIALLCAGAALVVELTTYRVACLLAAPFVVPLVALDIGAAPPVVLGAVAGSGIALWIVAQRWQRTTALVVAGGTWLIAIPIGLVGIWASEGRTGGYAAVVILTAALTATVRSHPMRPLAVPAAAAAVSSWCYRVPGPVSAALVAAAAGLPALVLRSKAWAGLQAAAVLAAAVTTLAAVLSDDPGVFAAGAVVLWALAARNVAVVPVALGPATALVAVAFGVAGGAGFPIVIALASAALAAAAVAVAAIGGGLSGNRRALALGGVGASFVPFWLASAARLADQQLVVGADLAPTQWALSASFAAASGATCWLVWRLSRPLLSLVAAVTAAPATGFAAAAIGLEAVEWYTLPAAAAFALAGFVSLRRVNSFVALGPAAALALAPTAFVAVVDRDLVRLLAAVSAAALVAVAAAGARRAAPLYVAAAVLVWSIVGQLNNWSAYVPRWAVLAVLGAGLLAAGVGFEASRRTARSALRFLRSLH